MMVRRLFAVRCALLSILSCVFLLHQAPAQTLDNGIDPSNLGKGDWIYFLGAATNQLGGSVPSVKSIPTLMSYYKSIGMQFLVVKAGTGSTNFNNNQFNSTLVNAAHAAGLKIFGYTRSFGTDIPGEIALAANVYNLGADGFILDAEAEWESAHLGANGPALAFQLCSGIKSQFPTKFLGHAPFPIISYHSSFPYKEFGYYCDAVMPQDYWTSIGVAPDYMVGWMDQEWRTWQNSLTGVWTNAIKPLAPIAQGWSPSSTEITTGTQVTTFADSLKNDPSPVTPAGYRGISFWRADLHTNDVLAAMAAIDMTPPLKPTLAVAPAALTIPDGSNATFSVITTGAPPFTYQWRFNSNNITGARSVSYTITNAQGTNAGVYSVIVSNNAGGMLSSNGTLFVQEFISDINAFPGSKSAVIIWTTRQPASAQLEYGKAPSLGTFTPVDAAAKTNHAVFLAGLESGSNYFFRVISTNAGFNRSTLSNFTTAGALLLDNPGAVFTGGWTTGTSSADKFGADYRFVGTVAGAATATASFTPNLPGPGRYSLYIWFPQGSNRATSAPVSVNSPAGTLSFSIDQTSGGGGWRLLATNVFLPAGTSSSVVVANNAGYTGKVVMADAVQFLYEPGQDSPADVSVPAWWVTGYFGTTNVNAALDPDGDGYPTWMEYVLGTNPLRADSRLDISLEKLDANTFRATCSPVTAGRLYEWQTRTSAVQGAWMALSNASSMLTAGDRGQTIVTNANSQSMLRLKTNLQ
ncbi:MAG TPA: immunoglobulin domain-containing protein [Candidatus Saccharimonadales bacterium]|nr:immunoglobulin domain-containing protein [Candidatus Saccharimonadales bacterium]